MSKYFNAVAILALAALLGRMAAPRVCRALAHWQAMSRTDGLSRASSEWADIYYAASDAEYVPLIKRMTDFYLPLLMNDFRVGNPKKAAIVVYSGAGRFNGAVGHVDALPMGAYYGGAIHIVSPSLWMKNARNADAKDYFIQYGPLIHELAHYAADLAGVARQDWLAEGVALYYEYKYTGVEWRPDLAQKAAKISIASLSGDFRVLDSRLAYRRAFDAIKAFVAKNGERRLQEALR